MSHFSIAVISEKPEDVERLLAPYQENNMGDCPEEYLAFTDAEADGYSEYQNSSKEMIRTPDGRILFPWDEDFRVNDLPGIYGSDTHKVPDGFERINVSFKERYATFDDFMQGWHGYSRRDSQTGKYGYWENPNAKWDYWLIGGRWSGSICTKAGAKANQCRISEIDLTLDKTAYDHAIRFWEVAVEGQPLRDDESLSDFDIPYMPQYYTDRYNSKEEYAKQKASFSTFALITPDGKWHEKGSMGWFGTSSTTKDSLAEYMAHFENALKQANPDFYLTVVDAHI